MSELAEVVQFTNTLMERSHYNEIELLALLEEDTTLGDRLNTLELTLHPIETLYEHLGYDKLHVLYRVSCTTHGRRSPLSTHLYSAMMVAQELCP
jgi:hypothetical protein